mmetsp:Transcript_91194/g.232098  ORF Transcript_91194/g.232098 Transcript_91194/m.232098 type:complete len:251 (-) Transcript_91194:711-1463(-)
MKKVPRSPRLGPRSRPPRPLPSRRPWPRGHSRQGPRQCMPNPRARRMPGRRELDLEATALGSQGWKRLQAPVRPLEPPPAPGMHGGMPLATAARALPAAQMMPPSGKARQTFAAQPSAGLPAKVGNARRARMMPSLWTSAWDPAGPLWSAAQAVADWSAAQSVAGMTRKRRRRRRRWEAPGSDSSEICAACGGLCTRRSALSSTARRRRNDAAGPCCRGDLPAKAQNLPRLMRGTIRLVCGLLSRSWNSC